MVAAFDISHSANASARIITGFMSCFVDLVELVYIIGL